MLRIFGSLLVLWLLSILADMVDAVHHGSVAVKVGLIYDIDDPIDFPENPYLLTAMQMAFNEINNSSTILPNVTLLPVVGSSRGSFSDGIVSLLDMIQNDGINAVIGDTTSEQSEYEATISSFYDILHIGLFTSATILTNRTAYPTYLSLIQPNIVYLQALFAFARAMGWRSVALMYSREPFGTTVGRDLCCALRFHAPQAGHRKILKLDPASLADRLSSLSLEPAPAMSNPRPLPEAFLKTFRAPVFTGKSRSSSVEDWLQQLEDYLDAAQVAPTHHIVAAKLCLKDQAYRWYRRQGFDEQSEGVFDDFKDRLRRRFGSPNAELIARDKLYSLVQRGSVTRYIEEFEDLSSQIEELGSADAMYLFQKGLKPKIREYIASNPDARKSLDVMMDVAENLDNVQYHGRQFYPQLAGGHRSHHVPARPPRPAPPARPMPEPMDVDVNAMEARGPPRSRFQQAATVSPKDRQKQEDLRHGSCFFCHRPGHQAKECPMKSGNGRPY
ncbi:periplasmic binding protein-like I [Polychytrium aggregatum]|uniref:periplasmic binding protein-like I n=1 Tax=Polychytrium aggregatum TaxID=110093 RepID=UPI0022FDEC66|nr:periplasmic binding protein-like I [Polychytrium aggregatum]KAI9204531.1 periplasmic binding protein-like I [Polychytrium aggregatum]